MKLGSKYCRHSPFSIFPLFLLSPTIFPWDLAILLLIAGSLSVTLLCLHRLKVRPRRGLLARLSIILLGIGSLIAAAIVAYGSFVEPQLIVVTERVVQFPSSHPLRIAVLSDFHLGPYKDARYLQRVVARVNALLPDLVLLVGDYLLDDRLHAPDLDQLAPLKKLQPAFGIYAVLGNHDYGVHRGFLGHVIGQDYSTSVGASLTSLGITVLQNENTTVDLGTESIAIAGVSDRWSRSKPMNLDAALHGIRAGMSTILLAHNPSIVLDTLSARAQLIVAGHTHGGQVRLPRLPPLVALPTQLGQKYDHGLFPIDDDSVLAITRGVGESGARARLFAPPEILLLTTRP